MVRSEAVQGMSDALMSLIGSLVLEDAWSRGRSCATREELLRHKREMIDSGQIHTDEEGVVVHTRLSFVRGGVPARVDLGKGGFVAYVPAAPDGVDEAEWKQAVVESLDAPECVGLELRLTRNMDDLLLRSCELKPAAAGA